MGMCGEEYGGVGFWWGVWGWQPPRILEGWVVGNGIGLVRNMRVLGSTDEDFWGWGRLLMGIVLV